MTDRLRPTLENITRVPGFINDNEKKSGLNLLEIDAKNGKVQKNSHSNFLASHRTPSGVNPWSW